MRCPMVMAAVIIAKGSVRFDEGAIDRLTQCGEWCGRWDAKHGQCSDVTLAQSSYSLKETIQNHLTRR